MTKLFGKLRSVVVLSGVLGLLLAVSSTGVARADSVCDADDNALCDSSPGAGGACVRDGKPGICVQRAGCNCEAPMPVEGGLLPGFPAVCWIEQGNEYLNVFIRGCNDTGETLYGVTPTRLIISTTGSAQAQFLSVPAWRRSLVDGNCVNFKTQVLVSGCGTIEFHGDITAEDPEGVTFTTGVAYCGSVVSNPIECLNIPPTPTRTPMTVPTPRPNATLRPTRTPLFTATPRPDLPTPTPKPTKEQPTLRPTRTPIPTATGGPFLEDEFTGRCIAINPHSSRVTVYLQLFNNTNYSIYDIVADELDIDTYGTVVIESIVGPVPRLIRELADGHSGRFEWTIQASGEGQIVIHASATGVGPHNLGVALGDSAVSTDRQECNVLNIPAR